jgi:predicted DNA-binding transcriptional regulator AlpA
MSELLSPSELADLLRRSRETIRRNLRRNPAAVPPRLEPPGARLLRWRATDVQSWLEAHVTSEGRS